MEITPRELRDVEIAEAFRGYNREVVNDLLERAAATVEAEKERSRELTERLKAAQLEADRSRETEDILHRTLLLAQRAADEAVAEAQQKAREMMEEAELESRRLLADAQSDAQRRRDEERERIEGEVVDLAARRDTLLADVEALTHFETDYRDRIAGVLENDLETLRTRPSAAPGPVPEVEPVELPVSAEAIARPQPEVVVESSPAPGAVVAGYEPDIEPEPEPEPEPVVPAFVETPADSETEADGRVDDDDDDDADSNEFAGAATREVDMTALFDAEAASAPPVTTAAWESEFIEPDESRQQLVSDYEAAAPVAASEQPARTDNGFDMLRPDALDAEVLDDDAFFATLREAVHDDAPLGPREDQGDDDFYSDEGERSSFRDVFRRRR
jgi:cell division septum initiation protein DivIVA